MFIANFLRTDRADATHYWLHSSHAATLDDASDLCEQAGGSLVTADDDARDVILDLSQEYVAVSTCVWMGIFQKTWSLVLVFWQAGASQRHVVVGTQLFPNDESPCDAWLL